MTNAELTEYIREYGKEIYSFCKWLTSGGPEADELYQDTWLVVVRRLDGLERMGNVKSYCLSVAMRLWKNKRRKYAWRQRVAEGMSAQDPDNSAADRQAVTPEQLLLSRERDKMVRRAVEELPWRQRVIVLLYYMEEQPLERVAEITGIPLGTVKSRLHHARKALRQRLKKEMEL